MPTQLKDFNPTFITKLTKFLTIIFPSTLIKVCLLNKILIDRFNSIISIYPKPYQYLGWLASLRSLAAAPAISSYPKPFQHKSLICIGLFSFSSAYTSKLSADELLILFVAQPLRLSRLTQSLSNTNR